MYKTREITYHYPHWPMARFIKRKRQKYIRIRVTHEHITVSGPWYGSYDEMERFLLDQRDWVDKTIKKLNIKKSKIEALREEKGSSILLRGVWKPLVHQPEVLSDYWRMTERDDHIAFVSPNGDSRSPSTEVVYRFYREKAGIEIPGRLKKYASDLPFSYRKVFIRSQKTKWGTCSSKGNLSFNWRLIKCPLFIWDYLFVHELCHTVHLNHSRDFWRLVHQYYPDYREAKQWIREHGELVFSDP